MMNPVDEITKEAEVMAKAREITSALNNTAKINSTAQNENLLGFGLTNTMKQLEAKIESA